MTTIHGYPPESHDFSKRGLTLCGEPVHALPDMREKVTSDVHAINCVRCLTSPLHVASKGTDVQKSEGTPDPFNLPEAEVRALLQAVLGWRCQGARQRWSTAPSLALVHAADRLRKVYPALCEELLPRDPNFCDYEDCDGDREVKLPDGQCMCRHHAAISLLAGMSADDARAAVAESNRVHVDPTSTNPACPYCVPFACPEHQPLERSDG